MSGKQTFLPPYSLHSLRLPHGIDISYADEGDKQAPVLLFVHGLASNAYVWAPNITALRKKFRCIAIDLPGHGASTLSADLPYSMHFFSRVLQDFMRALHLPPLTLVGHSMGGQISILTALRQPDQVKKLVLAAPAGFELFNALERQLLLQTMTGYFIFKDGCDYMLNTVELGVCRQQQKGPLATYLEAGTPESQKQFKTAILKCIGGMLDEPVFQRLHALHMPVLVLFGKEDRLIPNRFFHPVPTAEIACAGTEQIPHAQLELYSGTGHYLQWEQPEEFNRHVERFVK